MLSDSTGFVKGKTRKSANDAEKDGKPQPTVLKISVCRETAHSPPSLYAAAKPAANTTTPTIQEIIVTPV